MKRVCGWCSASLGPDTDDGSDEISHGICTACSEYFLSDISSENLGAHLERLPFAVLVVDDDVAAIDGNAEALELVGKRREEVAGFRGGDLLQCAFARMPGGCGRTEHCLGCAVRNTVTATFTSGEPQNDVPCYLRQFSSRGDRWIRFLLSTVKRGAMVVMKVTEVGEVAPPPAIS